MKVLVRCVFCDTLNRVDADRIADGPRCAECRKPILLDRPQKTTDTDFDRMTTESELPVLVDFWADWCGPCKRFAPTFEKASEAHPDVVFGKVDTEAEQELAGAAGIRSIPTLMAFRDGILVFSQPGALPPSALEQVIEGVKGLDMDDVRAQVAQAQAAAQDQAAAQA